MEIKMEEMKPIGFVAAMNAMSVKLIKLKRKNMIAWIIGVLEERRKTRDIVFHSANLIVEKKMTFTQAVDHLTSSKIKYGIEIQNGERKLELYTGLGRGSFLWNDGGAVLVHYQVKLN
jgi:hypothetical protein